MNKCLLRGWVGDADAETPSFHLMQSEVKAMAGAQLASELQTVVETTRGGSWERTGRTKP